MDRVQFILSTIRPMAEYTFPYLASIIGVQDVQTGQHVGSGLRCVLHGRRAVVTALHVIESASSHALGFALSAGYGKRPFVVSGPIHFDREGDVAVYFLPDDYPRDADDIAFWPEERIERSMDRLATDYLFVHGFPQADSQFLRLFDGVVSKSLPYGVMQRLEGLPADLRQFQFALDFDPANMRRPEGGSAEFIDPQGLSGSPVWRIGISGRSAEEWRPELSALVGVVTQWRPDEKLLVATATSFINSIIGG